MEGKEVSEWTGKLGGTHFFALYLYINHIGLTRSMSTSVRWIISLRIALTKMNVENLVLTRWSLPQQTREKEKRSLSLSLYISNSMFDLCSILHVNIAIICSSIIFCKLVTFRTLWYKVINRHNKSYTRSASYIIFARGRIPSRIEPVIICKSWDSPGRHLNRLPTDVLTQEAFLSKPVR